MKNKMLPYCIILSAVCFNLQNAIGHDVRQIENGKDFVVNTLSQKSDLTQDSSKNNNVNENAKVTELQELIVKGENAWFEDGKAVFIPKKAAKNLSTDMISLIDRMNTGVLRVEKGSIKTASGQSVNIFINGVPADNMDRATFWPKNAMRVEYMQSSNDPQFQGKSNILNFVMKDYVAGGLTKLNGMQEFPNEGEYSASSKLVWGKMTYNAIVKGGYSRDHLSNTEGNERYHDVWYNGTHHDIITRHDETADYNRSNDIYGGITARYRTPKFLMNHSVALQWNQNPGSGSHGVSGFTPEIISGNSVTGTTDSHSLSPMVNGSYHIMGHTKWTAGGGWDFRHSHNRSYYSYQDGLTSPIITASNENNYAYSANIYGTYIPLNDLYLQLNISEIVNIFKSRYSGNTESIQKQTNSTTKFNFHFWYQPISKITISIKPQLVFYNRDINHYIKEKEFTGGVESNFSYSINRKNNLSLFLWYGQQVPSFAQRNDLILRQTELKWIEGNPSVKPGEFYNAGISYFTMPTSWLNTSFNASYVANRRQSAIVYRSGGQQYDGVIGQYLNNRRHDELNIYWDIKFKLLNGDLNFGNTLNYNYYNLRYRKAANLRFAPYITWYFGNCSLTAHYYSPDKSIENGGTAVVKNHSEYNLYFSYGNGNFNLDVSLHNLFSKQMHNDTWFESGPYQFDRRSWHKGRSVYVSLTYTFDYGKKVTPGIDISTQQIRTTSVLGQD